MLKMFTFQAFWFKILSWQPSLLMMKIQHESDQEQTGLQALPSLGLIVTGHTLYSCYAASVWEFL